MGKCEEGIFALYIRSVSALVNIIFILWVCREGTEDPLDDHGLISQQLEQVSMLYMDSDFFLK